MQRNFVSVVGVALVGGMLGRGFRYLINVIISRGLGAEALGTFAFGLVVLKLLSVAARGGFDSAALKYVPRYRNQHDSERLVGLTIVAVSFPLVVGCVLVVGVTAASPLLVTIFDPALVEVLPLFAFGIPVSSAMFVGMAVTRGDNESKYAVYTRDFGQSVVAICLVAVGAYLLGDFRAVVTGYVFSLGFGLGLSIWFLWRQGFLRFDVTPTFELREWFVFSIPVVATAISNFLVSWTDILMLGALVPAEEIGWYQAAYQTSVLLLVPLQSSNSIFPSLVSGLYDSGELRRLKAIHSAVTKWILYLTGLGGTFVIIYRREVLSLFGETAPEAQTALVILAVGQFVTAGVGSTGYLLTMSGYERLNLINTVVTVLLNLGLNFVLIQRFGIVGAGMATAISLSAYNLAQFMQIYWILGTVPYSWSYWRGAIGFVVGLSILLAGRFIPLFPLGKALVAGILGLLGFLVTMVLLGFDQHDRLLIESLD